MVYSRFKMSSWRIFYANSPGMICIILVPFFSRSPLESFAVLTRVISFPVPSLSLPLALVCLVCGGVPAPPPPLSILPSFPPNPVSALPLTHLLCSGRHRTFLPESSLPEAIPLPPSGGWRTLPPVPARPSRSPCRQGSGKRPSRLGGWYF